MITRTAHLNLRHIITDWQKSACDVLTTTASNSVMKDIPDAARRQNPCSGFSKVRQGVVFAQDFPIRRLSAGSAVGLYRGGHPPQLLALSERSDGRTIAVH